MQQMGMETTTATRKYWWYGEYAEVGNLRELENIQRKSKFDGVKGSGGIEVCVRWVGIDVWCIEK